MSFDKTADIKVKAVSHACGRYVNQGMENVKKEEVCRSIWQQGHQASEYLQESRRSDDKQQKGELLEAGSFVGFEYEE